MAQSGGDDGFNVDITGEVFPDKRSCDTKNIFYMLAGTHQSRIEYTITNVSAATIQFNNYVPICKKPEITVSVQDEENIRSGGTFKRLRPRDRYLVKVHLSSQDDRLLLSAKIRIKFSFNLEGSDRQYSHIKFIAYDLIPPKDESLYKKLSTNEGEPHEDWSDVDDDQDLEIIWLDSSLYRNDSLLIITSTPGNYTVEHQIRAMFQANWPPEEIIQELGIGPGERLSVANYFNRFHHLLYLEELQLEKDLKSYTRKREKMWRAGETRNGTFRYGFTVPGLVERRPSVMRGDRIFVTPQIPNPLYKYEGEVDDVSQKKVYVYFHEQFSEDVREIIADDRQRFKIEFRFNRLPLRLMHRAVDQAMEVEATFQSRFFPQRSERFTTQLSRLNIKPLKFFSRAVEGNPEQKRAVQHIVQGTSGPAPYIIYGPPGTGKTFTLVEAIKQVYKTRKKSRILVCAPSNHAADLIVIGLLPDVQKEDILRLSARSRPFDAYIHKILSVSNCSQDTQSFVYPEKEKIEVKRVVVCTLSISGSLCSSAVRQFRDHKITRCVCFHAGSDIGSRLASADMHNHFTHLFIDEAGFATEPETLIPFCLVADCKHGMNGQIVLAGDPLQLGPVIRSSIAEKCLLGRSLLERLMKKEDGPYQPDDSNTYDPLYVTKLVQSFRSHPDILKIPNELFYNDELVACADVEAREKFCKWKHLKKKGFPIIFHGIDGRQEQNRDSPSWYNTLEAICVKEYVGKLMSSGGSPSVKLENIGIISPYHRQVKQIRRALQDLELGKMDDLKVGSVEKFLGDEREVIIISTVRSDNTDKMTAEDEKAALGFVANSKRFNVALTRAKALLIIIGNPKALVMDENWRRLITWIMEKGGYKGTPNKSTLESAIADIHVEPANGVNGETPEGAPGGASAFQQLIDDEWIPAE